MTSFRVSLMLPVGEPPYFKRWMRACQEFAPGLEGSEKTSSSPVLAEGSPGKSLKEPMHSGAVSFLQTQSQTRGGL